VDSGDVVVLVSHYCGSLQRSLIRGDAAELTL
jgi:hypothetical protein